MSLTINCPKCAAELKLPNRKLLGRKGKCPKCDFRFILQEPEEVQLELAQPEVPSAADQQPMVGTSAKWVPDSPSAAQEPVFPLAAPLPIPGVPSASESSGFDFAATGSGLSAGAGQIVDGTVPEQSGVAAAVPSAEQEGSIAARIGRRRKKRRTGPVAIGIGTALFAFCMIGLWWQQKTEARLEAERAAAEQQPKTNAAWEEEKQDLASSNEQAKQLSPTSGSPVPADYMPFTPHLLFHLRPSEVWARERTKVEFLASLGDQLGPWLETKIREITRFEPQEIEELTFAVNFGPRTAPPDVAAVVRLVSKQTASDMELKRFRGSVRPDLDVKIFESDQFSYMPIDLQTFAVAPVTMSDSLAEAKAFPRQPSVELEQLLAESDRKRQMTLMFDVTNIDTHREYIFSENMQALADEFVLWFGKDVQTVSWSFHLGADTVFMETLLRNSNTSSPLRVQRQMQKRLAELPLQLNEMVRFMKPSTVGKREMIGRFPCMMQATMLGTSVHVGAGYVRMVTLLPLPAASNIAAASVFTWDESLVTDFDGPAPVVARSQKLPDKVLDRLKQIKVDVDFTNTPLQEVMAFISGEIKTPIEIDGGGLKEVALTNNQKQNHHLGEIPAIQAFDAIVSNPDYRGLMVISVDEDAKKILVTSRPAAEAAGLPIFDTKQ